MSTTTTNFGLIKPELTDAPPDITVMNDNWDKVDTQLSNIVTYYNAGKSADDLTDPLALIPLSSTVNAELYAIFGGTYAYVETLFYSSVSTTSRRMQVAYSYNSGYSHMAMRVYSSSGWLAWKKIADTDDLSKLVGEITPDSIGAVKKSGDTMTGTLAIKNTAPALELVDSDSTDNKGFTRIMKNAGADGDYGTYISDFSGTDGTRDALILHRDGTLDQRLYLRSDSEDGSTFDTYKIYGEHNAHVGLKTYNALSDIGLTVGSETIADIGSNLPNNSILTYGVTTSNATIYPSNYGLLTVKRTSATRIEFNFVTTAGASYHGFYSITSNGNSWSDWRKDYDSKDILYGTSDLTAGTSTLETGKIYLVYE